MPIQRFLILVICVIMLFATACGDDETPAATPMPPTAAPTNTNAPAVLPTQEETSPEAAPSQPESPLAASAPDSPLAPPAAGNDQGVEKSGDAAAAASEDTTSGPDEAHCGNERIHPQAREFAGQFNVTPEEINGWFCQGIGFGEIRNAYTISLAASKPVTEVFALFLGGIEWGDIRVQLGLPPGEEDAQGND